MNPRFNLFCSDLRLISGTVLKFQNIDKYELEELLKRIFDNRTFLPGTIICLKFVYKSKQTNFCCVSCNDYENSYFSNIMWSDMQMFHYSAKKDK